MLHFENERERKANIYLFIHFHFIPKEKFFWATPEAYESSLNLLSHQRTPEIIFKNSSGVPAVA